MTTADPLGLEELIDSWDAQQAAYIAHREQRFEVMLDVIAAMLAGDNDYGVDGTGAVALDLACGPGSLSRRILERFSGIRVIGLDYDPALLALAERSLSSYGERFTAVDADLTDPRWHSLLPVQVLDIAVSSTALHWLSPSVLVELYGTLGALIKPGGVFLNADHLRYSSGRQAFLHALADSDDRHTQADSHTSGIPTWDQWWESARAHPVSGPHAAERERRFADRPPTALASLDFHLQALSAAHFSETGTVWQHFDDHIVFARR